MANQRVILWIMLFTCCWVAYMLRVNMSLNLIAMVGKKKNDENKKSRLSEIERKERTLAETESVLQGVPTVLRTVTSLVNDTSEINLKFSHEPSVISSTRNAQSSSQREFTILNDSSLQLSELTTMDNISLKDATRTTLSEIITLQHNAKTNAMNETFIQNKIKAYSKEPLWQGLLKSTQLTITESNSLGNSTTTTKEPTLQQTEITAAISTTLSHSEIKNKVPLQDALIRSKHQTFRQIEEEPQEAEEELLEMTYVGRTGSSENIGKFENVPFIDKGLEDNEKGRKISSKDIGKATKILKSKVSKRSKDEENTQDETFDWTESQQALILGSLFWAYPMTSMVGGTVAERWGARSVIFWASLVCCVFTALGPPAARNHYIALVCTRVIIGGASGLVYPAAHALIARWVPPTEKGKFVASMQGGTLGTVATWGMSGLLMEKYGWPTAFYVPALLTFIWCLLWCYTVANTPSMHPRISEDEKRYIEDALGNRISKSKRFPPYMKIATSIPFLTMVTLHYGNLWGLFFIMTVGPKFMASVLGFKLSTAGFVSGLPYLARLIFALFFGVIGDAVLSKNMMTTTTIRKFFCLFSHIIPGLLLICMIYVGRSPGIAVTLITLSMGFNGAATLTNLQNHQDLAPNFAGTLYGIANAIGSSAGVFAPILTAYFTKDGNTFDNWRPVFFFGAAVYIVSAFIFIMFGSGEVQPWNFESPPAPAGEVAPSPAPNQTPPASGPPPA